MGTAITVIIILLVIVVIVALVDGFVQRLRQIAEPDPGILAAGRRRAESAIRADSQPGGNRARICGARTQHAGRCHPSPQPGPTGVATRGALPSQERADVEEALSGAVRNLIVSVEAYPDLKSNQNFLELQRQLAETEDRIAAGRRYYNANVRVYNTKVESVPSNIIAGMFKFGKATYFEVNEQAVRQAPNVSFGEIAYRGDPEPGQLPQQQSNAPVQYGAPNDALPTPAVRTAPVQQAPYQQRTASRAVHNPSSMASSSRLASREEHAAPDAAPPQSDESPGGYQPPEAYPPGPTRQ